MITLLIHTKDLEDAFDIKDIFYNHSKVKNEPEILMKRECKGRNGVRKANNDFITAVNIAK